MVLAHGILKDNIFRCEKLLKQVPYFLKNGREIELFEDSENIVWINGYSKLTGKDFSNFYTFENKDYRRLNALLNKIAIREDNMKKAGYSLDGIKSFNRNIWLDLSRESNAIEGIFDDFSYDLLDFRAKLRGQIADTLTTQNLTKYQYFQKLLEQYSKIEEKGDCVVVFGRNKEHKLSNEMIRHVMAFKYAYKYAKKAQYAGAAETEDELLEILQGVACLLAGVEMVEFRPIQVYVNGNIQLANWTPVAPEEIADSLEALAKWTCSGETIKKLHPIERAAIFHAEFLRIHPYLDGNGRTARIMSNYLLMRDEMPTISIRYKNTDAYLNAINKGVETHKIDDLIDMFYDEVYAGALNIEKCLDHIEKTQKPKIEKGKE